VTSTVSRQMHASPADVWAVLADGWLYGLWVVGASRIRDVEGEWPAPGARIHHSVGTWPAVINDTTSVVSATPERQIELQARAWPGGEARVTITLEEQPAGTVVTMTEDASHGPARLIPSVIRIPALDWRNKESLQRLAYLAEGRESS
jgi:uncharacterized protein YndB with AHSA1/START domain